MKLDELKTALEKEGLLKMNYLGRTKFYTPGDFIYNNGQWNNIPDMFGIYKVNGTDEYRFFITDSERGISCYSRVAATEEEACEYLLDMARKGKNTFVNKAVPQSVQSAGNEKYSYYKFRIGNGAMRKKGNLVEYIDKNGNWVENIELLRKFIGLDNGFYEITEAEAEEIVQSKKNKSEN